MRSCSRSGRDRALPGRRAFFQAEDGIRDHCVTGFQTCALPIFSVARRKAARRDDVEAELLWRRGDLLETRSEERRVGKEWRSRWSPYHLKNRTCSLLCLAILCLPTRAATKTPLTYFAI